MGQQSQKCLVCQFATGAGGPTVAGLPNPQRGEIVRALVRMRAGANPSSAELKRVARSRWPAAN
jgi:hypothetical protein